MSYKMITKKHVMPEKLASQFFTEQSEYMVIRKIILSYATAERILLGKKCKTTPWQAAANDAAWFGRTTLLELMPNVDHTEVLRFAVKNNQCNVVAYFRKYKRVYDRNLFDIAVSVGNLTIMCMLRKHCDRYNAIHYAITYNKLSALKLLMHWAPEKIRSHISEYIILVI